MKLIDATYLPYPEERLRSHFLVDVDGHLAYYRRSAERYSRFMVENLELAGIPLSQARLPRQIEKDERFWTVTTLKQLFDSPKRTAVLIDLLAKAYGERPPIEDLDTWEKCVSGELRLYFEAQLPSPASYISWLRDNLTRRQLIPYILDAARRTNCRTVEGATHVDALFLNIDNGFALMVESKVLSDISYLVSFDNFRNQIARSIDVALESNKRLGPPLSHRLPNRTLFAILTPMAFREHPRSRLYGWIMEEYSSTPDALERDLPHRRGMDMEAISRRLGWITFEDVNAILPGSCPWLENSSLVQ